MAEKSKALFILSIVILLVGMTVGFILLALVYSGPVWVRFIVFVIYLIIAGMTIRTSKKYIEYLKK